ncbi:MAG: hypothetical protein H7839_01705 [Magnetococcus sp. YQC-5]
MIIDQESIKQKKIFYRLNDSMDLACGVVRIDVAKSFSKPPAFMRIETVSAVNLSRFGMVGNIAGGLKTGAMGIL